MNVLQQAAPTFSSVFAARLLSARLRSGLTQQQLADIVGVSQQAITQWEAGDALPRMRRRNAAAKVLGVDLSDAAVAEAMRQLPAYVGTPPVRSSASSELLMAELIIVTMLGALTAEQRAAVAAQLEAAGVVGADIIRSQERRAAIVAGSAA